VPPKEYVILDVPPDTPVMIPLDEPIEAAGKVLVHSPPGMRFDHVVVAPVHTEPGPVILPGVEAMVTVIVLMQPEPKE